jgi:MtfA peptidase
VLTGGKDIMDTYEITNPAKFFAVATETFFERPKQMKRTYSELYRELES